MAPQYYSPLKISDILGPAETVTAGRSGMPAINRIV